MARRKRPYVPKVKGCYECSQRRIDCDRTNPSCNKCASKGLTCSGFGFKYRFRNGFAPANKTRRSKSSVSDASTISLTSPASSWDSSQDWSNVAISFGGIDHGHPPRPSNDFGCFQVNLDQVTANVSGWADDVNVFNPGAPEDPPPGNDSSDLISQVFEPDYVLGMAQANASAYDNHACTDREPFSQPGTSGVFDVISEYTSLLESQDVGLQDSPSGSDHFGQMHPNMRFGSPESHGTPSTPDEMRVLDDSRDLLIKHFSDRIAPEMVVIDNEHNGWRYLVLNIARKDDLVMSAVLAASAFHRSGCAESNTDISVDPSTLYAQAIHKLQHRRELSGYDAETRQRVILAIVVLLVAVMINGCSDFPVMFRMLQSALDAIGGESGLQDGGEVAEFSLRQIRKMRVYAAPLLSPADGVHALVSQATQSFECLQFYRDLYPQYSSIFDTLGDLRRQAFDMYLNRVQAADGDLADHSKESIGNFIATLKAFPAGAPGEHILIWPCFIAALESTETEHQEFFEHFLKSHYNRGGFANILTALGLLRQIWARKSNADWPALLPGPQVFIM